MKINEPLDGNGLYVCVGVFIDELREFEHLVNCYFNNSVDLNLLKTPPHITVLYSETKKILDKNNIPNINIWNCQVKDIEVIYGDNDHIYLILNIGSNELRNLHQQWLYAGYKHSFDEFKPHITLVKDFDPSKYNNLDRKLEKLNFDIKSLNPILNFGEQQISNLES